MLYYKLCISVNYKSSVPVKMYFEAPNLNSYFVLECCITERISFTMYGFFPVCDKFLTRIHVPNFKISIFS